jgi:hypothetical protein
MEIWRLGTEVPRPTTHISNTICTVRGTNLVILEGYDFHRITSAGKRLGRNVVDFMKSRYGNVASARKGNC